MKKQNYSDLLKDPRWQKKRLEIMQRDGFKCKYCENSKDTLNVHHFEYGETPWDVRSDSLITLCEKCHNLVHSRGSVKIINEGCAFSAYDFIALDPILILTALCYIENHKGIWTIQFKNNATPYQIISVTCLLYEFVSPCDNNILIRQYVPNESGIPDFPDVSGTYFDIEIYDILNNIDKHE